MTDGSSPASPVLKDGNAVYTPGLSERRGSASKFYHGDALGSTRGITDSTQAVTDSQLYDAFGNTVSKTGTTPTPFGFVGKAQYQSDSDSGLQLLGHRYYDPSIGRFLSSDPAQAGTNWYAYCDNNPLKSIDPQGLEDTPPVKADPPGHSLWPTYPGGIPIDLLPSPPPGKKWILDPITGRWTLVPDPTYTIPFPPSSGQQPGGGKPGNGSGPGTNSPSPLPPPILPGKPTGRGQTIGDPNNGLSGQPSYGHNGVPNGGQVRYTQPRWGIVLQGNTDGGFSGSGQWRF